MGWVMGVFQYRKRSLMPTLLKSLDIPLLGDCCQLWNPWKAKDIQTIEVIQQTFSCKIHEVQHLTTGKDCMNSNYTLSRDAVNFILYIIYICKMTLHIVPNIDGTMGHNIKTIKHPRHGTQCVI